MGRRMVVSCLIIFGVIGLSLSGMAAEDPAKFPSKPINLTIGWAPGGGTDLTVRLVAKAAEKYLGQPIIIENKPGAGGVLALAEAKKARPDGYSLVSLNGIAACIVPHMRKVPYQAWDDFSPIISYGEYVGMLAVKTESPWKTVDDMMEYAKNNPKVVTVGVSDLGSSAHLTVEWLAAKYGTKLTFVPFGGGAPAVVSLLGGHISATSTSGEVLPHVRAGKLKILISYSDYPLEGVGSVPNLPGKYGFNLSSWTGIAAPKGVPEPILQTLDTAFKKGMDDPAFISGMKNLVMLPIYTGHQDLQAKIKADYEAWGSLVKQLKIGLYAE